MTFATAVGALCLVYWAGLLPDADAAGLQAPSTERVLEKEIVIEASLERVWAALTSEEGIRVISPSSNIDLRPGGPYELFLHLPPDEQGRRGAEGSRILTVLPRRLLAFDWTFPPAVPVLRREGAKTHVAIFLAPVEGGVRVRLVQYGWREGSDWDAGYRYFDEAWPGVLQTLKAHLESTGADLTARSGSAMAESLRAFIEEIPRRLLDEGPAAWLAILDSSDQFSMVTAGAMAFADRAAADRFLRAFGDDVASIDGWSRLSEKP